MSNKKMIFNRVLGLKFLYENFPYYYNESRIKLFFFDSKEELLHTSFPENIYDTILLKRSGNIENCFINDIECKDNRFFNNFEDLKEGLKEFKRDFVYCTECHKFRDGENYYSDRLAIARFSTSKEPYITGIDFIASFIPGVSTRDNEPYIMIDFPYNYGNIFNVKKLDEVSIKENNLDAHNIYYLVSEIYRMIDLIRSYLYELNYENTFQLIIRIDSYLNLLPIDFRTPEAWVNKNILSLKRGRI